MLQALLDLALHLFDLGVRGGFVSGVAGGQKDAGIMHHRHARGNMTDARAIVDQRLVSALRIPLLRVVGSDFELQRSGHAVHRLEAIVLLILPV